jgi:hypothetical protein
MKPKVMIFLTLLFISQFGVTQNPNDLEFRIMGSVDLYFSPGHEAEALFIAQLTHDANIYLQTLFGPQEDQIQVYALSRTDWDIFTDPRIIYGLHHVNRRRMMAPSDPSAIPPPLTQLMEMLITGFGYELARSTLHGMNIHELGHVWFSTGNRFRQRLWLEEVFCNLTQVTYFSEKKMEYMEPLLALGLANLNVNSEELRITSLDLFETDGFSIARTAPLNYGWYQARFLEMARNLYDSGGPEVLKNLWEFLGKYQTRLSDEELVQKLGEEVHPYFADMIRNW